MATVRGWIRVSSSCPRSGAWPGAGAGRWSRALEPGAGAGRWSRALEGTPKAVTISHEADGWCAIVSCAGVPTQPLPVTGRETGIDVGLKVFLVTAEGEAVENPRHYRRGEKKLAKAQRHVSRRTKGSHRRRKAVSWLAKAHQTVQRPRADHHHTTALKLLRQYDTISLEDVRVATLGRNHQLSKSISDAGWGQFRTILEAKAACAGRRVVAVPPAYTSQDCSGCGARVPKTLSVRTHVCPACGLVRDRDENATRTRRATSNGPGRPCGDSRDHLRGRTEHPSGFSPGECQFFVSGPIRNSRCCSTVVQCNDRVCQQERLYVCRAAGRRRDG